MSAPSEHRPPPVPLAENTVLAESATTEACADDYDTRNGGAPEHPSSLAATPHTHGRK